MERIIDTVTISLDEYNRLRDFNTNIRSNKTAVITKNAGLYGYYREEFLTESEAVKEIAIENESLVKELREARKPVDYSFLKKMSYWQFRKWKKENKD